MRCTPADALTCVQVTRHIIDAASGRRVPVDEVLEVHIRPGWKEGTRISFEGKGDELGAGQPAQDLVFVLKQAPHARCVTGSPDGFSRHSMQQLRAVSPAAMLQSIVSQHHDAWTDRLTALPRTPVHVCCCFCQLRRQG